MSESKSSSGASGTLSADPSEEPGDLPRLLALVVEDDPDTGALVGVSLAKEGFAAVTATSVAAARRVLDQGPIDLVILDLGLPDDNGLHFLQDLRKTASTPVIIVSGYAETTDRVVGLRLGADDYLVKPFASSELEARIDAVFRRNRTRAAESRLTFDDGLVIDLDAREVSRGSVTIGLRPREFELLAELAAHPRRVYSRDELLRSVWESSPEWQTPATVTEHVRKLRLAIEADPNNPRHLVTVRGVGYRFDP